MFYMAPLFCLLVTGPMDQIARVNEPADAIGQPPTLAYARIVDSNVPILQIYFPTWQEPQGGSALPRTGHHRIGFGLNDQHFTFFTAKGDPIAAKVVQEKLTNLTPVAVFRSGQADKLYVQHLNATTLILVPGEFAIKHLTEKLQ